MSTESSEQPNWEIEYDVVVLGMGAAGSAAAIEAHDAGCRVAILEKLDGGLEGGNTRASGGSWWINQDPERAATYLKSLCGGFEVPPAVIATWAEETSRNTAWVSDTVGAAVAPVGGAIGGTGPGMPPEFPELDGSDVYLGQMAVGGVLGGQRLITALHAALEARGIDVRRGTPARRLVQDPVTGRITGVVATTPTGQTLRVRAERGVVLATGGFEADDAMVRDYLRFTQARPWGSPHNRGDGHRMAQKVGADLWHMDNMMAIDGLQVPGYDADFYLRFSFRKGFIYVDADGRRVTNELPQWGHGQSHQHGGYELTPVRGHHAIFDEATRLSGPISPNKRMLEIGWNVLIDGYDWSDDNSVEVDKGWILRGDTLEELAEWLGVQASELTRSVELYNQACAAGYDEQHRRPAATLDPIGAGPYYAVTSSPMTAWSNGGPRRDEHCQVLDPFGDVIAGLYAAGSVSSTYSWGKDGGFHIADALAFGRVAGRSAAAAAAAPDLPGATRSA
ncbi:FAD-dependent oxidoreductase [Nocardioides sp.]|uniref:FAD-dependent oxidoreductase n=1 Tax=Nocardioides sp. TaxID=35761 RepID=UPI0026177F87|nr:FAD-dependent oxidoreductase [Nocardioides sp.]